MSKGEFRVCDCCFLKIREFQSQSGTTQCSWNGLSPLADSAFLATFGFPDVQTPVVIVSCCYFPDCVPYYGHMYLTREHVCFFAYKSTLDPICIPYEDVAAVVKPEFYFINALQLKSSDRSWFFAEFNGHRDMAYSRLDQLLSAHRQQYKESDHTPESLKEMASQRRQSYLNSNQRKNIVVREDDDFVPLPPDETLSKMTKILDTELQSDVNQLYDSLFSDDHGHDFYERVMVSTKDMDISIGAWQPIAQCPADAMSSLCVSKERMTHFRKVESKHPPKVTFPGLPPYAECTRYQLCRHDQQPGARVWTRFVLAETLRMKKIPYADYFEIETRWVFTLDGNKFCHAEVGIIVHFIKSTWFNNQIISSTISESKEAFETWANAAVAELRQKGSVAAATPPKCTAATDKSFETKPTQRTSNAIASVTNSQPQHVATTSAMSSSVFNTIAQGVRQQPLWAFTIMICFYMLYSLHTVHSAMRLALQRSTQVEERLFQLTSATRTDEIEAVVATTLKQLQLCTSPRS
ncbi:hypothetical protein, variant [Aphanomyces invadans]|nr:hypothetical protein, variant [Aphanomyces invadans]ETW09507.1 hypothetical protein, variant [Aphanomyces invadans]|eukprot:XP_008860918.1 hypothetical protein, variant [Aphanomyces invadans]